MLFLLPIKAIIKTSNELVLRSAVSERARESVSRSANKASGAECTRKCRMPLGDIASTLDRLALICHSSINVSQDSVRFFVTRQNENNQNESKQNSYRHKPTTWRVPRSRSSIRKGRPSVSFVHSESSGSTKIAVRRMINAPH